MYSTTNTNRESPARFRMSKCHNTELMWPPHRIPSACTRQNLRFGPRHLCVALLALQLVALGGCGRRTDRMKVSGSVTLNGAPLDSGSIRFVSVGREKLMAAGATVLNGEFKIPKEKGLTPGTYHLEINAPDTKAPPVMVYATPGGPGIPTQPERIPAEYNVDSKKTIEVTADGPNHFEFAIIGRTSK
jgi:hypothetical protein